MKSVIRIITKIEETVARIGILGFMLTIFMGAVTRALGHPLNWTADIALFLFAWTVFICGDIAFRNGRLVNVDLLIVCLPLKVQKVIAAVVYTIICAFLAYVLYQGIVICPTTIHRAFNGMKGFSYIWVALSIPVCFSLLLFSAITRFVNLMRSNEKNVISKM